MPHIAALCKIMNTEKLLIEIDKTFPFVKKPQGLELSFHKDDCPHCYYLRNDMEKYSEQIPKEGLSWLHNELSCLSSKGLLWVLPSLLRYCVQTNDTYDGLETEFLIYHLSPDLKYQKDTIKQLSLFSNEQIGCLKMFIGWCKNHEHWSEYCSEEISRAIMFLEGVNA